jgi:hypothetical protein
MRKRDLHLYMYLRMGCFAAACLLFAATPATADDWTWNLTPYAWFTDVGADVSIHDHEIAESEVDVADILDDTDFLLMLRFEAQKGSHGLFGDLFFVDLGDEDRHRPLPGPAGGELVAKSDLEMTILDVGGIYNPRGDGLGFALLYGARILDLDQEIDARVEAGPITTPSRRIEASGTLLDGLLGVRYVGQVSDRWLFNFRADASAGGSELTWSALAGAGWTFGEGGRHALLGGYRYMEIEFEEEDQRAEVETQLKLAGPYFAVKFGF